MSLTYLEIDQTRTDYAEVPAHLRPLFEERLVRSWLYHDHALEGVVLTLNDIERALSGQPCRNYCDGEIQKSLRRLQSNIAYIHDQADADAELTLEWLKDLHCRMCDADDEAAGRYRKRMTSPGVYNLDVVSENSISYYFHKFIETYNEELVRYHPIRAAAMAHWEFMHVFPFDERTGLVGRLMMNFVLIKNFYPPAIIHANNRHHYFQALGGHRTDLVPVLVEAMRSTIEAARHFTARAEVEEQRSRRIAL